MPTSQPTNQPSGQPSAQPSSQPSTQPTSGPSFAIEGPGAELYTQDIVQASFQGSVSVLSKMIDTQGVQALTQNNLGYTATTTSIFSGNAGAVKLLITKGQVPVNAVGVIGNTPLMWAAYWDKSEIAAVLIANGADVNIQNTKGETALSIAYAQASSTVVPLLIAQGAKM